MIVFTIFVLAGIVLCITKHRIWGAVCFVIALLDLFSLML